MGIGRDSRHKHRATGGRRTIHQKKRQFEMGRQPAMTKIGAKRVRTVRCRGGNLKFRALRLDTGNFCWASESCTRKTRILDVVYNASNNELVRTKTLVKNCIVAIDATPYKQWYAQHYGVELGKKKTGAAAAAAAEKAEEKKSGHVLAKIKGRQADRVIDAHLEEAFTSGRLLACVSSRPGQSGRCDGYILEGKELDFYRKKVEKKKK
eukprot:GILI01000254.1.p1 GENE.GILI01000254.1~~GILI01000254.1.p1  ORF type:complete len:208 (-),score=74.96 GILI01000254.1:93-716(-)